MKTEKKYFSVQKKLYIFIVLTVLAAALGSSMIAYITSADQIDRYYRQSASDNARNFSTLVDGDFLMRLRRAAETEEFQQLRVTAEEEDDDSLIQAYLEEHGLWEEYHATQQKIDSYLENMDSVTYLYLCATGGPDAVRDMYLIDDSSNPLSETGYYEGREKELLGMDLTAMPQPTISNGDWGWLCSAFYPVYTSDGEFVCVVGCDFSMEEVMQERRSFLIYMITGTVLFIVVVMAAAVYLSNRMLVHPLRSMTEQLKGFKPSKDISYEKAGVVSLDLKSHDEISEIYDGIRSMQINIIDYLSDLSALQEDKKRAEQDIIDKEEEIGRLSEETYKDALTGAGSKAAYFKRIMELNDAIPDGVDFALVMVDINDLKHINDAYGHRSGDLYIKGCCDMVCKAFPSSSVYRIGGDEFVVILTDQGFKDRAEAFETLRCGFANTYNDKERQPWQRYSAALGMAENASDDATVELVFKRADKAMYADKQRFKQEHGSYR